MALKLRTYEGQAVLSIILAAVGGLAGLALIGLIAWKFDSTTFYVNYNSKGPFLPLFGLGVLGGLAASTLGFFIALNSAGQRRNTRSGLAWNGFFLNAVVLTVVLSAAVFFYFTRNAITVR